MSRRGLLKGGGAAVAGWSVMQVVTSTRAVAASGDRRADSPGRPAHDSPDLTGEVVPWLDQPAPVPPPAQSVVGNLLDWEALESRITPADNFFTVKHYDIPAIDPATWQLRIEGLVARPSNWSLAALQARPRHEVEFTLECSGNTGLPFFIGGIGNAVWRGAALAPILRAARPLDGASEVVFWGADSGTVSIRDNSGVTSAGNTGIGEPDAGGGLDLTITEFFARSMSLDEALDRDNLLCYEMNGGPLPAEHGAPVRLIAPGWYGVANVKWLSRIEVTNQRFAGRFMARDYVTFREQTLPTGDVVWTFATAGPARLKSAPAKVLRDGGMHRVIGVAWGAPIARVDISIDGGPWAGTELIGHRSHHSKGTAWRFWTTDWDSPAPGTHTVTSRAIDVDGNVQPAADDPFLASRRTYWENNGQITRTVLIA
jgi:DMSO/TMAO reductase YedYZ molybdopterin-dependent catalytic subunit